MRDTGKKNHSIIANEVYIPTDAYTEKDITYDKLSRITGMTRFGATSSDVEVLTFDHDSVQRDMYGNITSNPDNGDVIEYNIFNKPRRITHADGSVTEFTYLADGTLLKVESGGTSKHYMGNMVFSQEGDASPEFESMSFAEGQIVAGNDGGKETHYHIKDHLGSVRTVLDAGGNIIAENDYYPYGKRINHDPSTAPTETDRITFSGKEDLSLGPGWSQYQNFGARLYSPNIGTWMSVDPMAEKSYVIGPHVYCSGNPINKVDRNGDWDVTVHLYRDRAKFGYGIAVVTDSQGDEVFKFIVRAEGTGGRDRLRTNSDTPLGIYDIPDRYPWITGGNRESYGPHPRLNMSPESGEIVESGRDAIRIHGGRQELYDIEADQWSKMSNPQLKKTQGCLRAFDEDMITLKELTDEIQKRDSNDNPGKVFVLEDLDLDEITIDPQTGLPII